MRQSHVMHARRLEDGMVAAGVDCQVKPRLYNGREVFHFATPLNLHSVSADEPSASWIANRIIELHETPTAAAPLLTYASLQPPVV